VARACTHAGRVCWLCVFAFLQGIGVHVGCVCRVHRACIGACYPCASMQACMRTSWCGPVRTQPLRHISGPLLRASHNSAAPALSAMTQQLRPHFLAALAAHSELSRSCARDWLDTQAKAGGGVVVCTAHVHGRAFASRIRACAPKSLKNQPLTMAHAQPVRHTTAEVGAHIHPGNGKHGRCA